MASYEHRFLLALGILGLCQAPAWAQASVVLEAPQLSASLRSDLETLLDDIDEVQSRLEARRQVRRAARLAQSYLNGEGYFAPRIETGVAREAPYQAWLRIDPGPQFTIGEISYRLAGPRPPADTQTEIEAGSPLEVGSPAIPETLLIEQQRLKSAYLDRGFADVSVSQPDLVGDRERASVAVTYAIETGRPVQLGTLRIEGERTTKDSFIQRLRPFEEGDFYAPKVLSTLNQRLSSTRHFRDISVALADPETTDASGRRDVVLTVEERPRHTIALGASIATDQGVGGLVEWTRWNLTGQADPLTLTLEGSQIEQSFSAEWRLPHFPKAGREISLQGEAFNENTDAFNRTGFTLGATLERASSQRTVWTFGGDYELSAERGETDNRLLQTIALSGALRLDRSNSLTDPTRGWRATLSSQPGFSFGNDEAGFWRNSVQVSGYVPLTSSDRWVVASRVELGSIIGTDTLVLPVDERFFSGGGASVRGFGFQELGPRDTDGDPVGGRGLFESSVEFRGRLTRTFGFAAFVDAGSLTGGSIPDFRNIGVGAGTGLRVATPAGPLRLDAAFPLNPTEFDRGFQLYFSIGQAF